MSNCAQMKKVTVARTRRVESPTVGYKEQSARPKAGRAALVIVPLTSLSLALLVA